MTADESEPANWLSLRFQRESVVRPAVDRIRRGTAWLAALLVLSQPFAQPVCRCAIPGSSFALCANSDVASPPSTCCRNHKCHEHTKPFATVMPRGSSNTMCHGGHEADQATLALPSPCRCPPSCPCRVEHAPPETAITNAFPDVQKATDIWFAVASTSTVAVERTLTCVSDRAAADAVGANSGSRCALLCRFVV